MMGDFAAGQKHLKKHLQPMREFDLPTFTPDVELSYPGVECLSDSGCSGQLQSNTCPLHAHSQFAEIIYITSGQLKYAAEGESYTLKAGDALYIPPGTQHRPIFYPCRRILIAVSRELLKKGFAFWGETMPDEFPGFDRVFQLKSTAFTRRELAPSFYSLEDELSRYPLGWEMKVRNTALDLICDLGRAYYQSNAPSDVKHNDLVERICQYIDVHRPKTRAARRSARSFSFRLRVSPTSSRSITAIR